MKFFGDASFVLALYRPSRFTAAAQRVCGKHAPLIWVSPITRVEVVRALARAEDQRPLLKFREDLAEGTELRTAEVASWSECFALAENWVERCARVTATGATDVLIVSVAALAGATHFLSFDQGSHQRAVALMAGLVVLPKPSSAEQALARSL
jgi:predicted nucleic acid-binding protein